jgi:heme/copper-type cytochrome/quinol oxidase subunit 3
MTLAQADPTGDIVDETQPWQRMRPQHPPPREPPPPEEPDDGGRFDGEDEPKRSRLNNAHLGMLMFVGAESMLFAALLGAFLVFRIEHVTWPPPALPRLPLLLTGCSTLMLLASALTMRQALHALRRWEQHRGVRFLALTAALGGAFLALQGYEWSQLIRFGLHLSSGVYGASFFVLIGCHALHVCSALAWVIVVWLRARRTEACMTRQLGVSLCSLYWYYVVAVWPVIYALVYLI